MNIEQENFDRECNRNVFKSIYKQSEGKRCGLPDIMKPAINWRETFKLWGYEPCKK